MMGPGWVSGIGIRGRAKAASLSISRRASDSLPRAPVGPRAPTRRKEWGIHPPRQRGSGGMEGGEGADTFYTDNLYSRPMHSAQGPHHNELQNRAHAIVSYPVTGAWGASPLRAATFRARGGPPHCAWGASPCAMHDTCYMLHACPATLRPGFTTSPRPPSRGPWSQWGWKMHLGMGNASATTGTM